MPGFCGPNLDMLVVTPLIPAEPNVMDGAILMPMHRRPEFESIVGVTPRATAHCYGYTATIEIASHLLQGGS